MSFHVLFSFAASLISSNFCDFIFVAFPFVHIKVGAEAATAQATNLSAATTCCCCHFYLPFLIPALSCALCVEKNKQIRLEPNGGAHTGGNLICLGETQNFYNITDAGRFSSSLCCYNKHPPTVAAYF